MGNDPVFGTRCGDSVARFVRRTSSSKMSLRYAEGVSKKYSGVLPKAGMMRSGVIYPLQRREPPTSGSASSSSRTGPNSEGRWPTPVKDGDRTGNYAQGGMSLGHAVRQFPTPVRSDGGRGSETYKRGNPTLLGAARRWPTPRASEWKGCGPKGSKSQKYMLKKGYLDATVLEREEEERRTTKKPQYLTLEESEALVRRRFGQLNPDWEEALMGLPIGWTDPERDDTEERRYPEGWLDGTWEQGIPRLTERREWRRDRLMALGNAVVPAQARIIAEWVLDRVRQDGRA